MTAKKKKAKKKKKTAPTVIKKKTSIKTVEATTVRISSDKTCFNCNKMIKRGATAYKAERKFVHLECPIVSREEIYKNYEKRFGNKIKPDTPIKQIRKIARWSKKRDKQFEYFRENIDKGIFNNQEYGEWIKETKQIQDNYFKAFGMKSCKSRDCLNPVENEKKDYCSYQCKSKEKSRRFREEHPNEYNKSKLIC